MTDKLSRLLKTLLAAFIMITSLSTSSIGVFAEEIDDENYDATEEIIRLGTYDEVFGASTNGIRTFSINTPSIGERYAKIPVFENELGYSYVAHLRINGNTVFCIQPGLLFKEDGQYPENYVYWDSLSESQRQAIWEISYYGYDYPGHQTPNYYIATQLMIWEVVSKWYTPWGCINIVSAGTGKMKKRYGLVYVERYDDGTGDFSRRSHFTGIKQSLPAMAKCCKFV